jgi:uncharacterized BrkB/YihY/UPF0761 family membrane protein
MRVVAAMAWNELPPPPKRRWMPPLAFAGFAFGISLMMLAMNWLDGTSDRVGLLVRLSAIAVFAVIGLGISLALPHRSVSWVHLWPGALAIAIGAQVIHLVSVLYLTKKLDSSSELYGGLGAAATVLLWLYLIGRLLVGASVLNASLWQRRRSREPDEAAA